MPTDSQPHTRPTQQGSSRPMLCEACSRPMESPLCCASCGALNPLPPSMFDYFELFGIPRSYDLDVADLRRRYLALSRSVHPDLVAGPSEETRRRSLQLSSGLNRAFDTLADPVLRAEYLLSLAGGPDPGEDKSVPPELLDEILTLRERIDEAVQAGDESVLAEVRDRIRQGRGRSLEGITDLCRSADLDRPQTRRALRLTLNSVKYWNNLLDHLPTSSAGSPEKR